MRNPFKKEKIQPPPKLLVLLHHEGMKESLEGVWSGNVGGHYQLSAVTIVLPNNNRTTVAGDVLVPEKKVAFLQVLGRDES